MELIEDALSDGFNYHNQLDAFILRSGISSRSLKLARAKAEERLSSSPRGYSRAPKRWVVQEILALITEKGSAGNHALATIVSGLINMSAKDALPTAIEAINGLKEKIESDKAEKRDARAELEAKHKIKKETEEAKREAAYLSRQARRDSLRSQFQDLMAEPNAQNRGYRLEQFLNDFFEFEGLDPRQSFKITGEQIDGSFLWRERTNLVEAKWVKEPVSGKDFGAFFFKVEGKTVDTRGLFISINGYSPEAIKAMHQKGALRFVCIDGAHLYRSLHSDESFSNLLGTIWRLADETGSGYIPVSELNS